MKRSDITPAQVVQAARDQLGQSDVSTLELLMHRTRAPRKVVMAAIMREVNNDRLDYGTSPDLSFPAQEAGWRSG